MNKGNASSKRRRYSSRLRDEQAGQTRERILAAVAALLRAGDLEEISFASVARNAGVSVPTVYRYFPSRDALFEGVQEWISSELKAPPFPKSWQEIADGAVAMFGYYESAADVFRTAMVTSLFRDVGESRRRGRDRALAALLAPLTDHLDDRRANALQGIVRLLYSFESYSFLESRFGVTAAEAGEMMAWVTQTIFARLEADRSGPAKATTRVKRSPKGAEPTMKKGADESARSTTMKKTKRNDR